MSQRTPTPAQIAEMTGCLCFGLRRATRAVSQLYDSALRPHGLRATQLPILVAACRFQGVPVATLAERLGMDRTTLLRNLRPLVRRKLLEVTREAASKRHEVRATRAGKAAVGRIYRSWRAAQDRVLQMLPDRSWMVTLEDLTATVRRSGG
jgi:DNA-binding MarR family transcriptional regulator